MKVGSLIGKDPNDVLAFSEKWYIELDLRTEAVSGNKIVLSTVLAP